MVIRNYKAMKEGFPMKIHPQVSFSSSAFGFNRSTLNGAAVTFWAHYLRWKGKNSNMELAKDKTILGEGGHQTRLNSGMFTLSSPCVDGWMDIERPQK